MVIATSPTDNWANSVEINWAAEDVWLTFDIEPYDLRRRRRVKTRIESEAFLRPQRVRPRC
jgi:hypothetical protein